MKVSSNMRNLFKPYRDRSYDLVYSWYIEKRDKLAEVHSILAPFASAFSHAPGNEQDSTIQLAKNARNILAGDRQIIKQLEHEQTNLLDQLDEANKVNEQIGKERDAFSRALNEAAELMLKPKPRKTKTKSLPSEAEVNQMIDEIFEKD